MFKNCFVFPSTCQKPEGIPNIRYEDLVKLLEVKLMEVWELRHDWIPLEFLTRCCPPQFTATVIHQLQFSFPYPRAGSHGGFSSWVSASLGCDSLNVPVCLSDLGGGSLPYDFTPAKGSKKYC